MREFDLNIEQILESWEVYHAVREIIANALDEQILSQTQDIQIVKKADGWHIIDFGRGLNYHHLTQNENDEKLKSGKLIGRFGVGLKDALATLYRHHITVKITSKHGIITLKQASKVGFDDIVTLHAEIAEPLDPYMIGTDFLLNGCEDIDIEKAKKLFLKFSNEEILEITPFGSVISISANESSSIYINGVKVAEEPNFLFSYNITSLTNQLKKALNRERTNVGRSAYADRIKTILTACVKGDVIQKLIDDLQEMGSGNKHDELSWNDVAIYASQKMSKLNKNTAFITADNLEDSPDIIDDMKSKGIKPIVVPTKLIEKMDNYNREADSKDYLRTTTHFLAEEKERLSFQFVNESDLTEDEKEVYSRTDTILELIGGRPKAVKEICISETIYLSELYRNTVGLWEESFGRITIKRNQLSSLSKYAGTLLHECAHASSGARDVSSSFEQELTSTIGCLAEKLLFYNALDSGYHLQSFDFSNLCYSKEFEMAGIKSIKDICMPILGADLKNALGEHIRSCNLSVEACNELVKELEKNGVYIHLDETIKPDVTRLPCFFSNPDIVEDADDDEDLDFEHQRVLNYVAWMLPLILKEQNLKVLHHSNGTQIYIETGRYAISPCSDYSGEIVFHEQKKSYIDELYPYNLLHTIIQGSSLVVPNASELLSEQLNEILYSLTSNEEFIVRLYYQYNYHIKDIIEIFRSKDSAITEYELALESEESPLAWGIKYTVEKTLRKALRKMRNPIRLRRIKAILDDLLKTCTQLEPQNDIVVQMIIEYTPFCAELLKQNPNFSLEEIRQAYLCGELIHWDMGNLNEKIGSIFPSKHLSFQLLNDTIMHKRIWHLWKSEWLNNPFFKNVFPRFLDITVEKVYFGMLNEYVYECDKAFNQVLFIKTTKNEKKLYGINYKSYKREITPDVFNLIEYPIRECVAENLYHVIEQNEILSKEKKDKMFSCIDFIETCFRELFNLIPTCILRDTITGSRHWGELPINLLYELKSPELIDSTITVALFSEGYSNHTAKLLSKSTCDGMEKLIVFETSTCEKRLYWWTSERFIPYCIPDEVLERIYNMAVDHSDLIGTNKKLEQEVKTGLCDCSNSWSLSESKKEFFLDSFSKKEVTISDRIIFTDGRSPDEVTIEEMELSSFTYNCLKRAGKETLIDLMQMTEEDMRKVRCLGRRSMDEVICKMREYGVSLKEE